MSESRDVEPQPSSLAEPTGNQSGEATSPKSGTPGRAGRRGPPPNPLYHPLFLPTLLIGFSLWFGWDGFLTKDPEMLEHQTFNRIMFAIMLPICVWMVPRGIKEFREDQARAAEKQANRNSA